MAKSDSKEMIDNMGTFMKACALLQAKQEVCISHACLCLRHRALSKKWLLKALGSANDLGISINKEAEVALFILSILSGKDDLRHSNNSSALEKKKASSMDIFHLYERGLSLFSDGYYEKPRLLVHFALAALAKGLYRDAISISTPAIVKIQSSSSTPGYFVEVLHAIDAHIIINVRDENMDGAVEAMNHRLVVVSKWLGSGSIEFAKELHRLSCLHSVIGNNDECLQHLEKAILNLHPSNGKDALLDSVKLLATSYEALGDIDNAISQYESVLKMENNFIEKAKLMNAIAHLHIQTGGQCHLAIENLEKSLRIQQDSGSHGEEGEESALLHAETMILYGNAMASQGLFSQAIYRYESALNANPDKSPIQSSNLRAWYNKGVTLLRSGDIIGAGHAFGIILDEVETVSAVARGTAFVLNAIGSIYFTNNDYAGAIERFKESLSLKNDNLSPCQRAGTFCNIANAYYKMGKYKESEENFEKAIMVSKSAGETSQTTEAIIMSKYARVLCKRKLYLRAYNMFLEGECGR